MLSALTVGRLQSMGYLGGITKISYQRIASIVDKAKKEQMEILTS